MVCSIGCSSRPGSPTRSKAVQVDEASAAEAHSGYASRSQTKDLAAPWGEQAALLHLEEQECTIEDLRGANEVCAADLLQGGSHLP